MLSDECDIIISRAGALSISELCLVQKPIILIPSPNVSEDHQTKNAMALVNEEAAMLVTDVEARKELGKSVQKLIHDTLYKMIINYTSIRVFQKSIVRKGMSPPLPLL